ncbi:MAG: hypothetical protein MZW92_00215 [Comamonadaceae bacterium]|nr:hypothetical protein [Comamonadaceae bacterium]
MRFQMAKNSLFASPAALAVVGQRSRWPWLSGWWPCAAAAGRLPRGGCAVGLSVHGHRGHGRVAQCRLPSAAHRQQTAAGGGGDGLAGLRRRCSNRLSSATATRCGARAKGERGRFRAERQGRACWCSARRWKSARTGIETLRALQAAREDAGDDLPTRRAVHRPGRADRQRAGRLRPTSASRSGRPPRWHRHCAFWPETARRHMVRPPRPQESGRQRAWPAPRASRRA